jgi:Type I restriction-modification system methyltransferase subunit
MAKKTKVKNNEPLEAKLWKAADTLRKNIDAAEYKHVVLGLIFLKYISDAFEELYEELKKTLTLTQRIKTNIDQKMFFTFQKRQDGARLKNMQKVQR